MTTPKSCDDLLPAELWHQIFTLATSSGCSGHEDNYNRTLADESLLAGPAYEAFLGDRNLKRNLALVSRSFLALSEPVRYETVVSTDEQKLVELLSMTSVADASRNRASYVKSILFHRPPPRLIFGPKKDPPPLNPGSMTALLSLCSHVRSMLLYPAAKPKLEIVECLMANLPESTRALKLAVLSDGPRTEKLTFQSNNLRILNLLEWPSNIPIKFSLPNLETLRISTDVSPDSDLRLPSLKHLHLRCASYEHSRNIPPKIISFAFMYADQLETLILDAIEGPYSDYRSSWLSNEFWNECTRLRKLIIDPVMGEPAASSNISLPSLKTFGFLMRKSKSNDALTQGFIEVWNWSRFVLPQIEEYVIYHAHDYSTLDIVERVAGYSVCLSNVLLP
ncbi:hypothetical protein CPB86DRAFT_636493 [Serendipita vermifera]|nr:hypothetical protein CPB86DRAFT_636493 [Serendipita vermifera]